MTKSQKKGSKLVTNIEDIINYYPELKFHKREVESKDILLDIPIELRTVYKTINDIPQDVNEIANKTGISISDVNYKIMLLQLDDKIKELPGKRFVRNDDDE